MGLEDDPASSWGPASGERAVGFREGGPHFGGSVKRLNN